MRKIIFIYGIASILLLSSFTKKEDENCNIEIENEVKFFFETGVNAFNRHDLDEFMNHFHEDIEMYTPIAGWLKERQAVRDRFSKIFEQNPSVKMDIEDLKVRKIDIYTVVVDFKWKVYPTGTGPAYYGITSGVYTLRNNNWGESSELEFYTGADKELLPIK